MSGASGGTSTIEPTVRAILQGGPAFSAVDTFQAMYQLQAYARVAEQMWEQIDVLLLPTVPTIYRIAEVRAEPVALNANLGLYTNFVNLLDMSAIAVAYGSSLASRARSSGARSDACCSRENTAKLSR